MEPTIHIDRENNLCQITALSDLVNIAYCQDRTWSGRETTITLKCVGEVRYIYDELPAKDEGVTKITAERDLLLELVKEKINA